MSHTKRDIVFPTHNPNLCKSKSANAFSVQNNSQTARCEILRRWLFFSSIFSNIYDFSGSNFQVLFHITQEYGVQFRDKQLSFAY